MRGGVDSIQLFKELFSQPEVSKGMVKGTPSPRGHSCNLGDLAIFY